MTPVGGGGNEVTSAWASVVEGSAETTVDNVPCARLRADSRSILAANLSGSGASPFTAPPRWPKWTERASGVLVEVACVSMRIDSWKVFRSSGRLAWNVGLGR